MTIVYTLQQAEKFAKEGNINAVDAFMKSELAKELHYTTIQNLRETLLDAVIRDYIDNHDEMDSFSFSMIARIIRMGVR